MIHQVVPFKIELTGLGTNGKTEENILFILRVMRSVSKDLGLHIDHPAVITLEDQPLQEVEHAHVAFSALNS